MPTRCASLPSLTIGPHRFRCGDIIRHDAQALRRTSLALCLRLPGFGKGQFSLAVGFVDDIVDVPDQHQLAGIVDLIGRWVCGNRCAPVKKLLTGMSLR